MYHNVFWIAESDSSSKCYFEVHLLVPEHVVVCGPSGDTYLLHLRL